MKKFILPLVISALMLFIAPGFAASSSFLYNPELRTDSMLVTHYSNLSKAGTTYAYRYHRHWHHRPWHRWQRWHPYHHRHHHYRYW